MFQVHGDSAVLHTFFSTAHVTFQLCFAMKLSVPEVISCLSFHFSSLAFGSLIVLLVTISVPSALWSTLQASAYLSALLAYSPFLYLLDLLPFIMLHSSHMALINALFPCFCISRTKLKNSKFHKLLLEATLNVLSSPGLSHFHWFKHVSPDS